MKENVLQNQVICLPTDRALHRSNGAKDTSTESNLVDLVLLITVNWLTVNIRSDWNIHTVKTDSMLHPMIHWCFFLGWRNGCAPSLTFIWSDSAPTPTLLFLSYSYFYFFGSLFLDIFWCFLQTNDNLTLPIGVAHMCMCMFYGVLVRKLTRKIQYLGFDSDYTWQCSFIESLVDWGKEQKQLKKKSNSNA